MHVSRTKCSSVRERRTSFPRMASRGMPRSIQDINLDVRFLHQHSFTTIMLRRRKWKIQLGICVSCTRRCASHEYMAPKLIRVYTQYVRSMGTITGVVDASVTARLGDVMLSCLQLCSPYGMVCSYQALATTRHSQNGHTTNVASKTGSARKVGVCRCRGPTRVFAYRRVRIVSQGRSLAGLH